MLEKLIQYSLKNKLIILLFTATVTGFGIYAIFDTYISNKHLRLSLRKNSATLTPSKSFYLELLKLPPKNL